MKKFPEGNLLIISCHFRFSGGWLKRKLKTPEKITDFTYYPDSKEIVVQHPGDDETLLYRVEHIHRNNYWLYYLAEVDIEPEDYYFKLKVRIVRA